MMRYTVELCVLLVEVCKILSPPIIWTINHKKTGLYFFHVCVPFKSELHKVDLSREKKFMLEKNKTGD